jgi:hypothetical protein
MRLNKEHTLFIVVLMLLVMSIAYRRLHPFEQARVNTLTYTGKMPAGKPAGTAAPPPDDLRPPLSNMTDRLLQPPTASGAVYQDLFLSSGPPREPAPPPQGPEIPTGDIDMDNSVHDIQDDPLEQIKTDIAGFRFYGTYEGEEGRAVFIVRNDKIIVAREGDRIDGKYHVDEIKKTHMKITALQINETIHLDMREFNNE